MCDFEVCQTRATATFRSSKSLWLQSRGCRFSKCCFGSCSGHVRIGENALALRLCSENAPGGFCKISTRSGAGAPERVGRGIVFQFSIYSIQLAVDRLTGDRWGQLTVVRRRPLHAIRPVASADIVLPCLTLQSGSIYKVPMTFTRVPGDLRFADGLSAQGPLTLYQHQQQ